MTNLSKIAGSGLTIICVAVVGTMFLLPLFKGGMDRLLGNAPLVEIELTENPGEVTWPAKTAEPR